MTKKAERHETPWMRDVMLALGARPDIIMWRQMTGVMCPPHKPTVFLHVGPPDGWPDLIGCQIRRMDVTETVNPESFQPHERVVTRFYGQLFGIETKTDVGKQSAEQIQAEKIFTAHYGIYLLAPSPRWDRIWSMFGREPDPACAEEADRMRAELGITGGRVEQPTERKPRRRARR